MRTRHTALIAAFAALAVLPLAGCGEDDTPPVASLAITSNDIQDGTLYVLKDTGVFVGVSGTMEDGSQASEEDLETVEWTTDDPAVLQVFSLGSTGVINGLLDWFDTVPGGDGGMPEEGSSGYEPEAVVTASIGDAEASIRVRVIINVAGTWNVALDDGTALSLELAQNGRTVTHEATGASGTIEGGGFSLNFIGYILNGTFTDRDHVEGDYTTPSGGTGTWSAVRDD